MFTPRAVHDPQPPRRNGHVLVPPNGDGWKVKVEGAGVDGSYATRRELPTWQVAAGLVAAGVLTLTWVVLLITLAAELAQAIARILS